MPSHMYAVEPIMRNSAQREGPLTRNTHFYNGFCKKPSAPNGEKVALIHSSGGLLVSLLILYKIAFQNCPTHRRRESLFHENGKNYEGEGA